MAVQSTRCVTVEPLPFPFNVPCLVLPGGEVLRPLLFFVCAFAALPSGVEPKGECQLEFVAVCCSYQPDDVLALNGFDVLGNQSDHLSSCVRLERHQEDTHLVSGANSGGRSVPALVVLVPKPVRELQAKSGFGAPRL